MKIGELEIMRESRQVLKGGVPVRMSSRAFDLLEVLLDADGAVVLTDAILARVWPSTIVEENNIQVHICTLRRVLGTHRHLIQTVSGRGYRMSRPTAPTERIPSAVDAPSNAPLRRTGFELPLTDGPLIGRALCFERIEADIRRGESIVSVTGAAGVGKSRIAVEVARKFDETDQAAVCYLSLASQSNQRDAYDQISAALDALHATTRADVPPASPPRLLVLDNIDLLTDAVVDALADNATLRQQSGIAVLVTSRAPLRVSMEKVIHLPSLLAVSPPGERNAALTLFVSRVRSMDPQIEITDHFLQQARALVEDMDGLPLAIELAAWHTTLLGIDSVRQLLQQNVDLPTRRMRRMIESRHESLGAALMWTWRDLTPSRQAMLAGLTDLDTDADLRDVRRVAEASGFSVEDTLDGISSLVERAFIFRQFRGSSVTYTIPNTVRRFLRQRNSADEARSAPAS